MLHTSIDIKEIKIFEISFLYFWTQKEVCSSDLTNKNRGSRKKSSSTSGQITKTITPPPREFSGHSELLFFNFESFKKIFFS